MLSDRTETEKNLINFFYIFSSPAFNFLHFFFFFFLLLFVILSNILFVNNLFFKNTLTQLNIFKINNIFFILISTVYIYL